MATLRGAFSLLLLVLNTLFWTLPILVLQLFKVLVPAPGWRRFWSRAQNGVGTAWISFNNWNLALLNPAVWEVEGLEGLARDRWYLVTSNHQSWVDILVLQRVLNRRVPFLKFFLKKELFWVPFLGLAWWALDYPFLERSGNAGRDLEAIRRAAGKFTLAPVSVMSFVEGTRFTPEKHAKQGSPYRRLLKPKAAGLAMVLPAMGEGLHGVLDMTIAYPGGAPTLWTFLCGRVPRIRVRGRLIRVGPELQGDFSGDKAYRRRFVSWLNGVWEEKDRLLETLTGEGASAPPPPRNVP